MEENKRLKINGVMLEKEQLKNHLEKIASSHDIISKSSKETYPIPYLLEDFQIIKEVYELLNEHVKQKINIHPAGEWLLDNFYVIEENVKQIQKELTLKKYKNFVGIANGEYRGFARIYVVASEIIAYTENKIEKEKLEEYLESYQRKKTFSMDEIWNIGIFLQIAIIQNIADICKKIARNQIQKYKVESIVERLVENKSKNELVFKENIYFLKRELVEDMKYPFIEHMSYVLKKYGKKGNIYLKILEEIVEKLGLSISEVIQKEHFDIAIQKVLIGNSITSLKNIGRINFLDIFEKINGVEEILKLDPSNLYQFMDYKTKECYRNKIKEISKKTKISEIYIAKKILQISQKEEGKKSHIGYYLIDKGENILYKELNIKSKKEVSNDKKAKIYIFSILSFSFIISFFLSLYINFKLNIFQNLNLSIIYFIISFLLFFIPSSQFAINLLQYILNKTVKPKIIPKMDYMNRNTKRAIYNGCYTYNIKK